MATASDRLGRDSSDRPIVLPITSRGLAVTDRLCWGLLGLAMVAAAGLILYLNRGTTFFLDELVWFYDSPGLDSPGDVLDPHNGHLIAITRLVYKAILETVGAEYVAFRVLAVLTVLLSAGLFYALAKRRIGALPALAPTLLLLFFGSGWQHVLVPVGFTVIFSIAAALAALLALERDDRLGDVLGCALLVLSVATYTTGLAFLVGIAVSVLIRPDRRRRAWIFLVPLALYAAWWAWSLGAEQSSDQLTRLSNILLIPSYVADSLASVIAALTGLDRDFSEPGPFVDLAWGRVLALLAIAGVALRLRGRRPPTLLWVGIGIVLTYWSLGALVADSADRAPWAIRYMYPGAVGVLLIAVAAAAGMRFSTIGLAALFAVTALSLATNLAFLRDAGHLFRDQYSNQTRADFAAVELARDRVEPSFNPVSNVQALATTPSTAGRYLAAVDRYGSPAYTPAQLQRLPEGVRENADQVLAEALGIRTRASSSSDRAIECQRSSTAAPDGFELPPGGATLSVDAAAPVPLALGRFADVPAAETGEVTPGEPVAVSIPPDSSALPWRASATGARSVRVCPLP